MKSKPFLGLHTPMEDFGTKSSNDSPHLSRMESSLGFCTLCKDYPAIGVLPLNRINAGLHSKDLNHLR